MNGKKAKLLRKLTGKQNDTKYGVIKNTVRNKSIKVSPMLNMDGTPSLDTNGNELWNTVGYRTGTIRMVSGARLVNKTIKNTYYNATRNETRNVMALG